VVKNINLQLFRFALRNLEFREFLKSMMNLTDKQIEKLSGCGKCLIDFEKSLIPRSIEKVNAQLDLLEKESKIQMPLNLLPLKDKELFTNKDLAVEFIQGLEDFKQIIIGIK